uniref:Uncharacterized protein n=1 Tax=Heterorhabditis bacteriophora TaxID=37862 RepID=A0A1I7WVW7_HETBA
MNSEQLQDFLTDLSNTSAKEKSRDDVETTRKFLTNTAHNTMLCINYITCNYRDIDLVQPIIAQILALFYKGGILRHYALQYIPSFISIYLFAFSKKQQKSISLFETFFLAIYNEEILAGGPKSENIAKKVEEVRIPSIRYPSIYHDPIKLNSFPETSTIKPGSTPSVLTTVRIGPFPTVENFTAEYIDKSNEMFQCFLVILNVLCVLAALLVGATWLLFEFRPTYRNRLRRTDSEQARIEMKSFEETRYLRRFSELKCAINNPVKLLMFFPIGRYSI